MPKRTTHLCLVPDKAVEKYKEQQTYSDSFAQSEGVVDYVPVSETVPSASQIIQNQHNHYYQNAKATALAYPPLAKEDARVSDHTDSRADDVLMTLILSTGLSLFLLGFLLAVAIGR